MVQAGSEYRGWKQVQWVYVSVLELMNFQIEAIYVWVACEARGTVCKASALRDEESAAAREVLNCSTIKFAARPAQGAVLAGALSKAADEKQ